MKPRRASVGLALTALLAALFAARAEPPRKAGGKPRDRVLDVRPKPIQSDPSVNYDYDVVYVRAPRKGDDRQVAWAEVFSPHRAEPGSDLVLLHPDGTEEVLVAAGDDAVADPF